MEDVCLGRKIKTAETYFIVGTASTPILSADEKRMFIIISSKPSFAAVSEVTVSTQIPAQLDQGFNLSGYNHPFMIHIKDYGDLVTKAWAAIGAAGTVPITVFVGSLYEECP